MIEGSAGTWGLDASRRFYLTGLKRIAARFIYKSVSYSIRNAYETAEALLVSEESLGIEEAARIVRLTSRTVRKLIARGELPGRKIGNVWRLSKRQLMECLNSNAN